VEGRGRALIHLDTHVVVWFYEKNRDRLSDKVFELLNSEDLAISPMVVLELQYLFEIDKITKNPRIVFEYLHERAGLVQDSTPFDKVAAKALEITWTRDPFDRLITAQAACRNVRLLTKDTTILKNFAQAVWDD
jgi:PIN domain nuclease of toxin-antitoxin system